MEAEVSNIMKKWSFAIMTALVLVLATTVSAFAFSDIAGDPAEAKINALRDAGLISGLSGDKFAPQGEVTYAAGIHLIVKGMNLTIDPLRFVKAPQASDYFTGVPDDAWYAQSFVVAHLNGLDLPADIEPNSPMSREEFAHYLNLAIAKTGEYAFTKLFVLIADEDQIDKEYMNDIQTLLVAKIAELDQERKFRPKAAITRSEAAQFVHDAIRFVESHQSAEPGKTGQESEQPKPSEQVSLTTVKVNDEVNKIVLSRGHMPNPGYRITIE